MTGRFFDEDTQLQYNRARWYDSTTGRWLSEDPIGFDAGDVNLSRYVGNGPTNATDPSGLAPPKSQLAEEFLSLYRRYFDNSSIRAFEAAIARQKKFESDGIHGTTVEDLEHAENLELLLSRGKELLQKDLAQAREFARFLKEEARRKDEKLRGNRSTHHNCLGTPPAHFQGPSPILPGSFAEFATSTREIYRSTAPMVERMREELTEMFTDVDNLQQSLELSGMTPGAGIAPDVANAGISLLRGDIEGFCWNACAAVPVIGLAAPGARWGKRGLKAADNAADAAKKAKKTVAQLEREANIAKGIPESLLGPSGKPKIIVKKHPTLKRSKDAARARVGKGGTTVKHPTPKKGGPHHHGVKPDGTKIRIHDEFPKIN